MFSWVPWRGLNSDRKGIDRVIRVKSRGNEPLEKLMRRFKKKCEKEGLIRDIKRSSYYEKPSERKRRKERKAIKRVAKQQAVFGTR